MQNEAEYKIQNWPEYNKALIQRGSITIWFDEESLKKWFSQSCSGTVGRPETYSDEAMLMLLIIKEVFKLTLRSLEGFARSIFGLMKVDLPVPSYSQISRRAQKLNKRVKRLFKKDIRHIAFDSTGLKVYGEGEWKVRVHGKSKRRTWRKLHLGIDLETQEVVSCELTKNDVGDAQIGKKMLGKLDRIESARGDGAYDSREFRATVHKKGGICIVPPPRDAVYKGALSGWERERDACLAAIKGFGGGDEGRRLWKMCAFYHERSLAETVMFRIKRLFGDHLKARNMEAQSTEAICKCLALNKMTKLGMPKGEWIEKVA